MDQWLPVGLANGVGIGTLLVFLFWMLATGRLCTGRELTETKAACEKKDKTIEVKDQQLWKMLTEYLPAANSVMTALHDAAVVDEVKDP